MAKLWGREISRQELLRKVGDMSQVAGVTLCEFTEGNERGSRAAVVRTGGGLEFTVLLDRGMSIDTLMCDGVPFAFKTAAGVVNPSFCNEPGLEWLRTWPAGFLTPCGLQNVGSPCVDNGKEYGLHGRLAGTPARNVHAEGRWTGESQYRIEVRGTMRENILFGENLALTRTIASDLGGRSLTIEDSIENLGHEPVPFFFLQHINFGFPLVDASTELVLPEHTAIPRDKDAEPGITSYRKFSDPVPGYREQCFYHDVTTDSNNQVTVSLVNRQFGESGMGVTLRYRKEHYPILVEWKMMGEGTYVVGLEPSNCHVEGRVKEREKWTVPLIGSGETITKKLEIEIACGPGK